MRRNGAALAFRIRVCDAHTCLLPTSHTWSHCSVLTKPLKWSNRPSAGPREFCRTPRCRFFFFFPFSRSKVISRRQSVAGDQSIALTEPRPFNLRSEERGKAKQALLAQRLEEKRRQVCSVYGAQREVVASTTVTLLFFILSTRNACAERTQLEKRFFRADVHRTVFACLSLSSRKYVKDHRCFVLFSYERVATA